MENLIIITGEQGSGKTTYALRHYGYKSVIFEDATHKDWDRVVRSVFENDVTVVVCQTENAHIFIPKSKKLNWKMVTIKNNEVIQTCGRLKRLINEKQ